MKYLNKLIEKWKSYNVIMEGCTVLEIKKIEKTIANDSLPKCYKEFLENTGKNMTDNPNKTNFYEYGSFIGNAVFIGDLEMNNNEDGLKGLLLEDESTLEMPEKAFVFYGSQGILYAYFNLDEGDNPPVYGYAEGFEGDVFPEIAISLSSFYERYLENDNSLFQEVVSY